MNELVSWLCALEVDSNIHPVANHERRWCLWCNILPQIRTTMAAHKLQSLAGNAHPLEKMHPPM